jgi:hypothetical protein
MRCLLIPMALLLCSCVDQEPRQAPAPASAATGPAPSWVWLSIGRQKKDGINYTYGRVERAEYERLLAKGDQVTFLTLRDTHWYDKVGPMVAEDQDQTDEYVIRVNEITYMAVLKPVDMTKLKAQVAEADKIRQREREQKAMEPEKKDDPPLP